MYSQHCETFGYGGLKIVFVKKSENFLPKKLLSWAIARKLATKLS